MKRITIAWSGLLFACLLAPTVWGQGLITNGTFDSDASGWTARVNNNSGGNTIL